MPPFEVAHLDFRGGTPRVVILVDFEARIFELDFSRQTIRHGAEPRVDHALRPVGLVQETFRFRRKYRPWDGLKGFKQFLA